MSWLNPENLTILAKVHTIGTNFTMIARPLVTTYVILVDAVIEDIPFVLTRYLKDRVMGSAIYLIVGILYKHDGLFSHFYRTEWRLCSAVRHMVIGRTVVRHQPRGIVITRSS